MPIAPQLVEGSMSLTCLYTRHFVCLALMQVLYMLSQSVWVHKCFCFVCLEDSFLDAIDNFQLLQSFCPSFYKGLRAFRVDGTWMSHVGLSTPQSYILSTLSSLEYLKTSLPSPSELNIFRELFNTKICDKNEWLLGWMKVVCSHLSWAVHEVCHYEGYKSRLINSLYVLTCY